MSVFRLVEPVLGRAPGAFAWALCGLDLWFSQPREIAIVGPADSPVARAALAPFQPNTVVAVGPSDDIPLLAGKTGFWWFLGKTYALVLVIIWLRWTFPRSPL